MCVVCVVKIFQSKDLYNEPLHPYSQVLLSAVPVPNLIFEWERVFLKGDVPRSSNPPTGCTFHTRCPHVMRSCRTYTPILQEVKLDHSVACHLYSAAQQ